jgi:hypothetical protein
MTSKAGSNQQDSNNELQLDSNMVSRRAFTSDGANIPNVFV